MKKSKLHLYSRCILGSVYHLILIFYLISSLFQFSFNNNSTEMLLYLLKKTSQKLEHSFQFPRHDMEKANYIYIPDAFWDLFTLLRVWCSSSIAVHSVLAESAAKSFSFPRDLKSPGQWAPVRLQARLSVFFRYQTNSSIQPQSEPKLSGMEHTTRINQKQMPLINQWGFYPGSFGFG